MSNIYEFLSSIGYHHPLHPVLTHLPVGLTMAAFLFIVIAYLIRRPQFDKTARHCTVLAVLAIIPTAILGYYDWQHFLGGSFLFPIKMKLGLAFVLFVSLLVASFSGLKSENVTRNRFFLHVFCLVVVIGIGFFGGELVFEKKKWATESQTEKVEDSGSVSAGPEIFSRKCAVCHYADRTETKVGPGLKGLFQRETMTVSGWPVSRESVKRQLKTPFDQMPSFDTLEEEEIKELTDYLESI